MTTGRHLVERHPGDGRPSGGAAVEGRTGTSIVSPGPNCRPSSASARTRLRWALFRDILRPGAVAAVSTVQTNLVAALTTALVGAWYGPDIDRTTF